MRSETTQNHQLRHQLPSVSLMQLLVTTGLIAIAVAFMQKTNFSYQNYDNDQKNQFRNVIFALPLAVIGLAAMEGESRRIILAGKLAYLATASTIVIVGIAVGHLAIRVAL